MKRSIRNGRSKPLVTSRRRVQSAFDDAPSDSHLRILDAIRRIPPGFVTTYGQVAQAAGLPGRARLVGRLLSDSPLADGVPWHRVINASGRISERGGPGPDRQRRLLAAEGVELDGRGRIDLKTYLWRSGLPMRRGRSGL